MNRKKVVRIDTGRADSPDDAAAAAGSGTDPFPRETDRRDASSRGEGDGDRQGAGGTRGGIAPTDSSPRARPTTTSEDAQSMVSELRDLCEAALLKPLDSPSGDPLAALELRPGQTHSARQPHTTNHIADELVRRIKSMPQLRARVMSQLLSGNEPPLAIAQVRGTDSQNALKELRAVRTLLDNLGCPRSEDDKNLSVVERIRWLLDIVTATQTASGAVPILPGSDHTPMTGIRWIQQPDPQADEPHQNG